MFKKLNLREEFMKRTMLVQAVPATALLWSAGASAQQFGTSAEAKAMLEKAVAEMKAGEAAAIAKFNDKDNKTFRDRDLYVFCYTMSDGKFTAHPNPALMNTDIRALKVGNDNLGERLYNDTKEGAVGSVDYNFP